jgi:hypothetical protein
MFITYGLRGWPLIIILYVDNLGIQASGFTDLMALGIHIIFSFLLIIRFLVPINHIQLIASASLVGPYHYLSR